MAMEIEPGPTVSGRVNGKNAVLEMSSVWSITDPPAAFGG